MSVRSGVCAHRVCVGGGGVHAVFVCVCVVFIGGVCTPCVCVVCVYCGVCVLCVCVCCGGPCVCVGGCARRVCMYSV